MYNPKDIERANEFDRRTYGKLWKWHLSLDESLGKIPFKFVQVQS